MDRWFLIQQKQRHQYISLHVHINGGLGFSKTLLYYNIISIVDLISLWGFYGEHGGQNPNQNQKQNQKDSKKEGLDHELRGKMMTLPYKYVIHNTDTQKNVYNSQQRTLSVSPSFGRQLTSTFWSVCFVLLHHFQLKPSVFCYQTISF